MKARSGRLLVLVGVVIIVGCPLFLRYDQFGPVNFFNRKHCFEDERPLDREVAIELSKRTFAAEEIEEAPMTLDSVFVNQEQDRAKAYWKEDSVEKGWGYDVVIERHGSYLCCRALRPP